MSRYPSDGSVEPGAQPDRPADGNRSTRSRRLRSYTLTGGRTRSAASGADLSLETLISVTVLGDTSPGLSLQQHTIIQMCRQRLLSVAEISAHLQMPIGVARVLVGDMIADGMVSALRPAVATNQRPTVELLQRVLAGLRTL